MTRSLVVQSVLYGNRVEDLLRAFEALVVSLASARDEGVLGDWVISYGDSSSAIVLESTLVEDLTARSRAAGGSFTYEFFGANLGHGGGHNRLQVSSQSDLLLILNPDGQLAPDSISRLMEVVSGDVALADARQIPLEHPKDYDPVTGDESWASGACSIIRRDVFAEVGGFDDATFFMYCDDVDLSWRVRLAGYRVVYAPHARVFHDKRLTVSGDIIPSDAEIYYSAEAAVLLAHKYSRPEIAHRILAAFEKSSDANYLRVVQEYRRRDAGGSLPRPLDPSGAVSQFVNGNYAVHRY